MENKIQTNMRNKSYIWCNTFIRTTEESWKNIFVTILITRSLCIWVCRRDVHKQMGRLVLWRKEPTGYNSTQSVMCHHNVVIHSSYKVCVKATLDFNHIREYIWLITLQRWNLVSSFSCDLCMYLCIYVCMFVCMFVCM